MVKLSLVKQKRKFIWVSWETHFFQYTKKAVYIKLVYLLFVFFIETENVFFPVCERNRNLERLKFNLKPRSKQSKKVLKGTKKLFPISLEFVFIFILVKRYDRSLLCTTIVKYCLSQQVKKGTVFIKWLYETSSINTYSFSSLKLCHVRLPGKCQLRPNSGICTYTHINCLWGVITLMLMKEPELHTFSSLCCCCCCIGSVVSDSVRPHRRQPTRLLCPGVSPGKNTGVGCHFLLQCMHVCMLSHFSSVWLCATPWTAAHQAPLSTGFSRHEHWSGLSFPSPSLHYALYYMSK